MSSEFLNGISMRLFGMPYQFPDQVDPRIDSINKEVGYRYAKNIAIESPVMTVIPGRAIYLPGMKKSQKTSATLELLDAALKGTGSELLDKIHADGKDKKKDFRLYDFQIAYNEYFDYVNLLCRVGATFLGLKDSFKIPAGDASTSAQTFDWRNWHWSGGGGTDPGESRLTGNKTAPLFDDETPAKLVKKFKWVKKLGKTKKYLQFYIDPDIDPSDEFSNTTSESQLLGLVGGIAGHSREAQFLASTAGTDISGFLEGMSDATKTIAQEAQNIIGDNGFMKGIKRIVNLSGEMVKGNNLIAPEIYQNSNRSKNYSITIHLKTPYGNKYGYYMDIYVPLMHLLPLCIPKATTANSYSEPFLMKMEIPGLASVNLGIGESIAIRKATDTLSVEGLPTEVDVTLNIKDLYLDLSMNSTRERSTFINNVSLVEYLSNNCGISIINPSYEKRFNAIAQGWKNYIGDTIATASGGLEEGLLVNLPRSFGLLGVR